MTQAKLAHRWDDVRGLRMRSLVAGDPEAQVVVLVHGLGLASDSMADMAASLAPEFRVYVPDLPGFGASDHPPRALSIRGLADALDRWCETVGVTDAVMAGNSYGAQVVTELAAREAEEARTERRVRALALIGPTSDPGAGTVLAQVGRWVSNASNDEGGSSPTTLLGAYLRAGVHRAALTARSATRHRMEDRLPLVAVPTLIIAGGRDKVSPPDWTERLTGLLADGERRMIDDGAHSMHGSHPDRLAHLVRLFIRDRVKRPTEAGSAAIR